MRRKGRPRPPRRKPPPVTRPGPYPPPKSEPRQNLRPESGKKRNRRTNLPSQLMNLKVLLPFKVFAAKAGVLRIVAETRNGSFGLLPHRMDCVAALAPGILTYQQQAGEEFYVAVDEGVLVKTGLDVLISVRNAIGGTDLGQLKAAVEKEFLDLNDAEKNARSVMLKMESGFIQRLAEFHLG